jgi:hypothetical protein
VCLVHLADERDNATVHAAGSVNALV